MNTATSDKFTLDLFERRKLANIADALSIQSPHTRTKTVFYNKELFGKLATRMKDSDKVEQ